MNKNNLNGKKRRRTTSKGENLKCVLTKDGKYVRVSIANAQELVAKGGKYISKSIFRGNQPF